jgi:ATP-binding cassette subfamily B protein
VTAVASRRALVGSALALPWRAAPLVAAFTVACTVLGGAFPAVAAWLTKRLVDTVTTPGTGRESTVVWLAAAAALAGAVTIATLYLSGHAANVLRQRVGIAVESRLFERITALPGLRYFEDPAFHDRLRLAEQGAQEAPHVLTGFAQEALRGAVVVAGFAGVLLTLWAPAAGLLALSAAMSVVAHVATGRRQAAASEASVGAYRRRMLYRTLLTDVRAAKEVRLFGLGPLLHGRMVASFRDVSSRELEAERRGVGVQVAAAFGVSLVNAVGLVVVARHVLAGRASVGDLALFLAAQVAVQGAFTGVVVQSGEAVRALSLYAHYRAVLDAPDDLADGDTEAPRLRHAVELRDVWFRYDDTGPWVLRGVTLTIPAGSTLGLVGVNGAGKSTLVRLLCRFYDPQRGEILWDGAPLPSFVLASLRRRVSVTFQDFMAYDLSAAENVGLGDATALDDRARIEAAAARAGAHEVLSALPHGYDTLLSRTFGDGEAAGVTLSGGQWQRVAVARALMREGSDVMVLDEPSASLDPEAEHRLSRALRDHAAGLTTVLVSHRLSTLRDADAIAYLDGGVVAEHGTHDALMALGGGYARLFRMQGEGYRDPEPVA